MPVWSSSVFRYGPKRAGVGVAEDQHLGRVGGGGHRASPSPAARWWWWRRQRGGCHTVADHRVDGGRRRGRPSLASSPPNTLVTTLTRPQHQPTTSTSSDEATHHVGALARPPTARRGGLGARMTSTSTAGYEHVSDEARHSVAARLRSGYSIHTNQYSKGETTCARASASPRWHSLPPSASWPPHAATTTSSSDTTTAPADTTAGTTGDTVAPSDLKLGVAFDTGGRGDGTFNDSAAAAPTRPTTELGATVDELEATTADDRKPNLETLTGNGNNPVIAVGFAFGDALAEVAAANPDTSYAIVDGFIADAPQRQASSASPSSEGSFLVGAAAALKSELRQDRLHRWPGDRPHQEVRGRLHRWCQVHQPRHRGRGRSTSALPATTLRGARPTRPRKSPSAGTPMAPKSSTPPLAVRVRAPSRLPSRPTQWAIGVDSDQYLTATPEQQAAHPHLDAQAGRRGRVRDRQGCRRTATLAGGFKTFDLSVDGVGYSTSGGYLDDVDDQLDEIKADIVAGDDRRSDRALIDHRH